MRKTAKTPNWSCIRKDSQISICQAVLGVLLVVLTLLYAPFSRSFAIKNKGNPVVWLPLFFCINSSRVERVSIGNLKVSFFSKTSFNCLKYVL